MLKIVKKLAFSRKPKDCQQASNMADSRVEKTEVISMTTVKSSDDLKYKKTVDHFIKALYNLDTCGLFTVEKARSMISIHKMRSRIEGAKFALGGDYYTTSIKKILLTSREHY